MRRALCLLFVLTAPWALLSCSCSSGGEGTACTTSTDCAGGERCLDGRCQLGPDADADSAPSDGAPADTGPRTDTGTVDTGTVDTGTMDTGTMDTGTMDTGARDADEGDATCGGGNVPIDLNPPNVLLIFDRSCSMRRQMVETTLFGASPEDGRTRWNVAREAVRALTLRYPGRVRWGLMAFPDPREGCGDAVEAEVAPAPATADLIYDELRSEALQPFNLCGLDNTDTTTQPRQTPSRDALEDARLVPELSDPDRESFAILITDGGASCGVSSADLTSVTTMLRAAGIETAVVGFTVGATESTLEAIAAAGGLPRPGGPPSFYGADDAADLEVALDTIVLPTIPCTFGLEETPPAGVDLFVALNDVDTPEDAADGWTHDAASNSVTLHGSSCDRLRSGDITRISVAFGCPPRMCAPVAESCNGLDDDCDDIVDEDCLL